MSIALLIGVHDGLVIAADSASALTISVQPGVVAGVANVYDNANKIFNLYKGKPIGCVTFGSGSIGSASIGTLMKDLRAALMGTPTDREAIGISFDKNDYTMEGLANTVSQFVSAECAKQPPANLLNLSLGLLIGGYSTNGTLGESWHVEIQAGKPQPVKQMRQPDQPGITWGGMAEAIQRLVLGYSPTIFQTLAEVSGPQATAEQLSAQLTPLFAQKLQAPLVFAPMPIQDAIDLARFLVHSAIMYTRFLPGPQIVGGPIEIAAITKHEGFRWISRKHYYEQSLNQEPQPVVSG